MVKKTERFNVLRKQTLNILFTEKNLSNIWRNIVRNQMRDLDIKDLHDYYDFNLNIKEKTREIKKQILDASYRASSPLIYRVEKRFGICRQLMIPSPSDALVFQTITEHLYPQLEKAQPTKNAFYSRDKHQLKLPHEFREMQGSPWFVIWPKFQKQIWRFTDDCTFVVETDITNFFDNIGLRELRNIVASRIKVEEVILDLLFNVIEQLAWVPDYLPTSLKGLPTINVEAFRLLPHVMLFEIDEVINAGANGNFVRWMDDINIGVNSREEAYIILGNVNDVLKSRGLALNISKTNVYTSEEAKVHFMVDENRFLDEMDKIDQADADFKEKKKNFLKRFRKHLLNNNLTNWDKVTKRYFTLSSKLHIKELLSNTHDLFIQYPSLRSNILLYISSLGFSKRQANLILSLMQDVKSYDDVTIFQFSRLITGMNIPRNKTGINFIEAVDQFLSLIKSDFDFYCYLWFLAKYGKPYKLMNLIMKERDRWRNENFLARQVVSVLPRLLHLNRTHVLRLLHQQMVFGPRDAASVASNIHSLSSVQRISGSLYPYLFPGKLQKPYPLPKYLILFAVLSSRSLLPGEKARASAKIKIHISDSWYLYWLKRDSLIEK